MSFIPLDAIVLIWLDKLDLNHYPSPMHEEEKEAIEQFPSHD